MTDRISHEIIKSEKSLITLQMSWRYLHAESCAKKWSHASTTRYIIGHAHLSILNADGQIWMKMTLANMTLDWI